MTNKADYTKSKCFKEEEITSDCGKFGMSFTKEVGAGLDLGAVWAHRRLGTEATWGEGTAGAPR